MAGEFSRDAEHGAYDPEVHLLCFKAFCFECWGSDFAEASSELGCVLIVGEDQRCFLRVLVEEFEVKLE